MTALEEFNEYVDEYGTSSFTAAGEMTRKAIAMRDELLEEVERWKGEYEAFRGCAEMYKAEVERLKMVYEEAGKWIANLKAEVEKLRWMTKHFISYADAEHGQKEDEVCEYEDWEVADLARRWEEHGA